MAAQAERMSPFTRAVGWDFAVGFGTDASEVTRRLDERADVVIDVTGSHSTTRLLHRRGIEAGKPLVSATWSVGSLQRGMNPCVTKVTDGRVVLLGLRRWLPVWAPNAHRETLA